jgi:hypothetical protein
MDEQLRIVGFEALADVLVETVPVSREPVARTGGLTSFGKSTFAAAAIAMSVVLGGNGAAVFPDLARRTQRQAAESHAQATPVTVAGAEIARNIRERARLARRHLVEVPRPGEDGPDDVWL